MIPGDTITYADINLRNYRGTVVSISGNFIDIQWEMPRRIFSREWIPNLLIVEEKNP